MEGGMSPGMATGVAIGATVMGAAAVGAGLHIYRRNDESNDSYAPYLERDAAEAAEAAAAAAAAAAETYRQEEYVTRFCDKTNAVSADERVQCFNDAFSSEILRNGSTMSISYAKSPKSFYHKEKRRTI